MKYHKFFKQQAPNYSSSNSLNPASSEETEEEKLLWPSFQEEAEQIEQAEQAEAEGIEETEEAEETGETTEAEDVEEVKEDVEEVTPPSPQENPQQKRVNSVKLQIEKKIQEKQDEVKKQVEKIRKRNKENFLKLTEKETSFSSSGKYSFLINVFSQEKEALAYIKRLKTQFPVWNFFINLDNNINFRIYLGPFNTKQEAQKFINNLSSKPFPNYFLENVGL